MAIRTSVTTNWAGTASCSPQRVAAPTSTEELVRIVAGATSMALPVKAIGAGHSFTPTAMTDGILIRLDRLDVGPLQFDTGTGRVVCSAGLTLHDLNHQLHRLGRALPNLGDIDVQTIAGATQTATHGTGHAHPNLAAGMTGFELVTAAGDVRWCSPDSNVELFHVGRVGLGALGLVTRVELETVPAFNLRAVETVEPLADLLADWTAFTRSAPHAEFFFLPGVDRVLVKRNTPTDAAPSVGTNRRTKAEKLLVENLAFGAAMRLVRRAPATRSSVLSLMSSLTSGATRVAPSHEVFASPRHVRFVEMEYGIPVDAVPEALERVRRLVDTLSDPPSFPIEVRVSAADGIPLSTATGRASGWIAVHRYQGTDHEPYFRGVESIMDDYDGRPHWGKMHFQTAATLRHRYPEWDRFIRLRDELDPNRTFDNDYLRRVIG